MEVGPFKMAALHQAVSFTTVLNALSFYVDFFQYISQCIYFSNSYRIQVDENSLNVYENN